MSTLSTDTDGLMIDLSYSDIRKTLDETLKKARLRCQSVPVITQQDIERARQSAEQAKLQYSDSRRTRLAVLPHLPLGEMSFDPNRDEVRVAAELREKFRQLEGADVKSTTSVRRYFELLQARGLKENQFLQTLANGLDVDYVLWGTVNRLTEQPRVVQVRSTFFSRSTGEPLFSKAIQQNLDIRPAGNVTGNLAQQLVKTASVNNRDPRLAGAFQLAANRPGIETDLLRPVATQPGSRDEVLSGLEFLEQALEFPVGSEDGAKLLSQARQALEKAVDPVGGDADNPLSTTSAGELSVQ